MTKNAKRSTYDPSKWGKKKPKSEVIDKNINSLTDDTKNSALNESKIPVWGFPLVFISDGFIIYILTFLSSYFLQSANPSIYQAGVFFLIMDFILISLFIQVLRGNETVLEINLIIVVVLLGLIFLYLSGGGGVPGSTS